MKKIKIKEIILYAFLILLPTLALSSGAFSQKQENLDDILSRYQQSAKKTPAQIENENIRLRSQLAKLQRENEILKSKIQSQSTYTQAELDRQISQASHEASNAMWYSMLIERIAQNKFLLSLNDNQMRKYLDVLAEEYMTSLGNELTDSDEAEAIELYKQRLEEFQSYYNDVEGYAEEQ